MQRKITDWREGVTQLLRRRENDALASTYAALPFFRALLWRIRNGRPCPAVHDGQLESETVRAFHSSHGTGRREDLGDGRTFHIGLSFTEDGLPVLSATYYDGSCAFQTRLRFNPDGGTSELGIQYPYSEIGVTGRSGDGDLELRYGRFDRMAGELAEIMRSL